MPPTTRKTAAAKKTTSSRRKPQTDPTPSVDSADPYAPNQWGSTEIGGLTDLRTPSGQLCLVRRPGVEGLLSAGVLNDLDSFTALIQTEHIDRVDPRKRPSDRKAKATTEKERIAVQQKELEEMMKDPSKLASLMHTVDRVVCHVVVKPDVRMTPNDATSRKKNVIYADMIDMVDKMFIFNFVVGGSRDIDRFLDESGLDVGGVGSEQGPEGEAE